MFIFAIPHPFLKPNRGKYHIKRYFVTKMSTKLPNKNQTLNTKGQLQNFKKKCIDIRATCIKITPYFKNILEFKIAIFSLFMLKPIVPFLFKKKQSFIFCHDARNQALISFSWAFPCTVNSVDCYVSIYVSYKLKKGHNSNDVAFK